MPLRYLLVLTVLTAVCTISATGQSNTKPSTQKPPTESRIEGSSVILKVVAIRQNSADTRGEPAKGTKFVSIQIVADNSKGTEEWDIEPSALKLKDVDGNVYEVELFTSVAEPTLKSGVIDAGDRVRGWVTFQVGVSIDVSSLRLRYEGTLGKSGWITLSSVVEVPRGDRSGLPPVFYERETL